MPYNENMENDPDESAEADQHAEQLGIDLQAVATGHDDATFTTYMEKL